MDGKVVGIVREWKTDSERRAPLAPENVAALSASGQLSFVVEPSPVRIFTDDAYRQAGARISDDLSGCQVLLGIKEVPISRIRDGKPYLFFSHTHKGQPQNRKLLKGMLDRRCTLIDYELVRGDDGKRLIFFGVQAGQAGMVNSLWSLGRRLRVLGVETPFALLKQAREYAHLAEAKAAVREVRAAIDRDGLPEALQPLVIGITGVGNVSKGAREILALLDPVVLEPDELVNGWARPAPNAVYQVVFRASDRVRRVGDAGPFDRFEYRQRPDWYESVFTSFLPHLTVLVTGNYWDPRYPRIVTKDEIATLFGGAKAPKLLVIGDVSCDVEGGIECTLKATFPENPVFTYDPLQRQAVDGFEGKGVVVMAVEILPSEIPLDSTQAFGRALGPWLPDVASTDFSGPLASLALPEPFARAVIAHQGELAPRHRALGDLLKGLEP